MTYNATKNEARGAIDAVKAAVEDFSNKAENTYFLMDNGSLHQQSILTINHAIQRMNLAIGQYIDYANAKINQEKMGRPTLQ